MELNDHKVKRSALRRASSSRRTTRSAAIRIELRASPITRASRPLQLYSSIKVKSSTRQTPIIHPFLSSPVANAATLP
ncbi:unnamed protein product [Cercopithifilaria johnstoni]|uniref:Uncharacterized protein n=1 Tax=Cercopithifilaria johnstoni TaxID=2874296 RepID=A0A8J2M3L7_9BILA|nr:unnamed protein product [Cercopithifilaria johnstoni]